MLEGRVFGINLTEMNIALSTVHGDQQSVKTVVGCASGGRDGGEGLTSYT